MKKTHFFDKYKNNLNERQLKSIKRMFLEGPKGFDGGMTAKKYMRITQTSKATATRDLKALEMIGAFIIEGKGRNTPYYLNLKE